MRGWLFLATFPAMLAAFDIDLKPFASRYSHDTRPVDNLQLNHVRSIKSSFFNDDYSDNSVDMPDPNATKLLQQYYWLLNLMLPNYAGRNETKDIQKADDNQQQVSPRSNDDERRSEDPELPREVQPPPL